MPALRPSPEWAHAGVCEWLPEGCGKRASARENAERRVRSKTTWIATKRAFCSSGRRWGGCFFSEGIQKFLFPGALVGGVEIIFGILVLLGWYAGWAAIPLLRVVRAFSLMQ